MKKTNIIFRLIIVSLIAVLFTAGIPKDTLAATDTLTWNGSGCPENCNWNVASNWDEDRIPKNGDSLIFPAFEDELADSVNNIIDLTIKSITLTEANDDDISYGINLKEPVTITGGIYNYTNGGHVVLDDEGEMISYRPLEISGSIILGGDIDIETESIIEIANRGSGAGVRDTIDLNGHSMSFVKSKNKTDLSSRYLLVIIAGKITGKENSKININDHDLHININGDNTYIGETNVNNGTLSISVYNKLGQPLGGSKVTVNQSKGHSGKLNMNISSDSHIFNNKVIILGIASVGDLVVPIGLMGPGANDYVGAAITIYHSISKDDVFTFKDLNLWGAAYMYQPDIAMEDEESVSGLIDISSLKLYDVTGKNVACGTIRFMLLDDEKFSLTNDAKIANFITNLDKNGCAISQYVKEAAKDVTKVEEEAVEVKAPNTVAKIVMNNPSMALLMGLVSIISIIIFKKSITSKYK